MKLNLNRNQAENFRAAYKNICDAGGEELIGLHALSDWLTLEAECVKRGKLIERLSHALMNESENTTTRKLTVTELALSAVESWRKEQK